MIATDANASKTSSSNWIGEFARKLDGRGAEVLRALGLQNADEILAKRKFSLPGSNTEKQKSIILKTERVNVTRPTRNGAIG